MKLTNEQHASDCGIDGFRFTPVRAGNVCLQISGRAQEPGAVSFRRCLVNERLLKFYANVAVTKSGGLEVKEQITHPLLPWNRPTVVSLWQTSARPSALSPRKRMCGKNGLPTKGPRPKTIFVSFGSGHLEGSGFPSRKRRWNPSSVAMAWRLEDQLPLGGSQCQARGPEALSLGLALSACKAENTRGTRNLQRPAVCFFQGIIFEKKHKTTGFHVNKSMNTSPHSFPTQLGAMS